MCPSGSSQVALLDRLVEAVNTHDIDGLTTCFAEGYVNETPAHPGRGFRGRDQVRRNWAEIFRRVPDVRARVHRRAIEGPTVWSEWEMGGSRADGAAFLLRGVIIFGVAGGLFTSARFYLEPVEDTTGDIDDAVRRVVGSNPAPDSKETS